MRVGWRLPMLLALVGGTGAGLALVPEGRETGGHPAFHAIPLELGGWTSVDGAPDWALPRDPNEQVGIRRTYRRDDRVVWASVAHFARQDDPKRRQSLDRVYPEANVSRIDRIVLPVALNGATNGWVSVPVVIGQRGEERLVVVYWHQLGPRAYGSEYGYRLALMRETLLRRQTDVVLFRLAIAVTGSASLDESFKTVQELAPALYGAASPLMARVRDSSR